MNREPVFGFISSPVPGHMYPMSSVALALKERGAKVIYFTLADSASLLTSMGIEVCVYGESLFPRQSWEQRWSKISRQIGFAAAWSTVLVHRDLSVVSCQDLPKLFEKYGVTHLVADQNQCQARALAETCNIPYVNVTCTVPMNRDETGDVPPPSEYWVPPSGFFRWLQRLRNRLAFTVIDFCMLPISRAEHFLQKRKRLPRRFSLQDSFSREFTISGLSPSLGWPGQSSQLTYVGHLIGQRSERSNFPWEQIDSSKPLVYVSLGTISINLDFVYDEVVKALSEIDVQFIVARGKWQKQGEEIQKVKNGWIVSYMPQMEVLKRTNVFVNHAGINSVVESVANGVPLVLLPITNDQPGMATRSVNAGIAVTLRSSRWRARHIREAVLEVLKNPTYSGRAREIQKEVLSLGGPTKAGDLILQWAARSPLS